MLALRRVLRLCGCGDAEGDDHDGCQDANGHGEVLGEVDMILSLMGCRGRKSSLAGQKMGQVTHSQQRGIQQSGQPLLSRE